VERWRGGEVESMSNITSLVGEKIRSLRQVRELSQEQLAFKAGLNTSYLGQIERGEKSPTIVSLEKIAIALDADIEQLFRFDQRIVVKTDLTFVEKISYELRGRSEEEKKAIYEFVKQLLWFRDKK